MKNHSQGWSLERCAKESSEYWLKNCIGSDFDMDAYLSEGSDTWTGGNKSKSNNYTLSLAQQCEYAHYKRLLKSMRDSDRLRLMANSGPTQSWITALPLSFKNWNLSSRE